MFEGDIVANCTASWYDPVKTRRMVIVGSRRMLIYDEDEPSNKITVFNRGYAPHQGYDQFGNKNWRLYDDGFYHPPLSQTEPLRLECEHFLSCILDGDTPRSDGQAGLEVVRILEAVDRSLMNGGMTIELASK
jgi:predicted dehydrogenase